MQKVKNCLLVSLIFIFACNSSATDRKIPIDINKKRMLKDFFETLKSNVGEGKAAEVAKMCKYPLTVHLSEKEAKRIKNKSEFVANYPEIFNENLKHVVLIQSFEKLFENSDGIAFWHGTLWIERQKDKSFKIKSIFNNLKKISNGSNKQDFEVTK